MKNMKTIVFMILGCAMLAATGCAKHEMVKADEPIGAPATAATLPQVKEEPVSEQPVVKPQISQVPIKESVSQDAIRQDSNTEKLQAALNAVYFNFDSYTLSGTARSTLVTNADLLKNYPAAKVRIAGNCDERGSDEYNLALGERRAKSAMQYLTSLGIPSASLSVVSYGKEKPAVPGQDETAWSKNRRDDFVVVTK
jgi:peptidoglycan-associated lipoprotein